MEQQGAYKVVIEQNRLPKAIEKLSEEQRRALAKVIRALEEPTPPPHLGYEKLKCHPNWRSVRLDNYSGYRVIFYEDDGYRVLAWVGAHDDAYRWAERNKPQFNQYGEFEFVPETLPSPPRLPTLVQEPEQLDSTLFPFAPYQPSDLVKLGVPNLEWAEYLRQLRRETIETETTRMKEVGAITESAWYRLNLLALGQPLHELLPPAQLNLLVEEYIERSIIRGVLWKPEDLGRAGQLPSAPMGAVAGLSEPVSKGSGEKPVFGTCARDRRTGYRKDCGRVAPREGVSPTVCTPEGVLDLVQQGARVRTATTRGDT